MALSCTHLSVESCGATHFPVAFGQLRAELELHSTSGTEHLELVAHNPMNAECGRTPLAKMPAAERSTCGAMFKLLAETPGLYTVALVADGKTIKEATLHVRQAPSIRSAD